MEKMEENGEGGCREDDEKELEEMETRGVNLREWRRNIQL